jgi:hypothetical protein
MLLSSRVSREREEDASMPSEEKPNRRSLANVCYALATCAMGAVGWFFWSSLNRPPAPPIAAEARPVVSLDEQLRSGSAAAAAPTVVTPLPTSRPTRASKPAANRNAQHVRGGITIVGPAGTTSAVAPPTKNDLSAPSVETVVNSTLLSTPANAPAAPDQVGPKLYTAPAVAQSTGGSGRPSAALRFYSFDANTPYSIQKLNRGESADKWQKRVTLRPN